MKKRRVFFAPFALFLLDIALKKFVYLNATAILSGAYRFHFSLFFVNFDLAYLENKGMAWGMFSSFQMAILLVRIVVIGAIIYALFRKERIKNDRFAFLMILFGAIGNVFDTLTYGFVIDMLHFTFFGRSYGVFNIADAMIFIGAFCLLLKPKRKDFALKD